MISSRLSLLVPRLANNIQLRWYSLASATKTIDLKQGHTLHVYLGSTPSADVSITAKWQDHCDIDSNSNYTVVFDAKTKTHRITSESDEPLSLAFVVPEYVNVGVFSNNELNLSLKNKV